MTPKSLVVVISAALSTIWFAAPAPAATIFTANLSGPAESPPNASTATGFAVVTIDGDLMRVEVTFSGLTTPNTNAHIHCCTTIPGTGTAGVATTVPTFTGFPTGAIAGTYDHTFNMLDLASYNPAFLTANSLLTTAAAEAFLFAGLAAGQAYLNIHTTMFSGGEIRGFLAPVPLPAALPLFATGLGALALIGWRKKRKAAAAT